MKEFENALKNALIEAYITAYGENAWINQNADEKTETLHNLLGSFLTVAKNK